MASETPVAGGAALPRWQDDEEVSNCARCNAAFSMLIRKHHCRKCGKIFCATCSNKKRALPTFDMKDPVRLCDGCDDWELGRIHFEEKQVEILLEGEIFKKHAGGIGMPRQRVIKLNTDRTGFTWSAAGKKPKPEAVIYLEEIKKVVPGITTDAFKRTGNKDLKHLCFSFIAEDRTLDLECDDNNIRETWVAAVKACLIYGRTTNPEERKKKMMQEKANSKKRQVAASRRKVNQKTRDDIKAKYNIS